MGGQDENNLVSNAILPLVSVIVPVYNVAEYLPDLLDSLRKQTFSNIEILLINDGSIDSSRELCVAAALNDPRIKLIEFDKNLGVSAARNAGLDHANGTYLSFVDSDDKIEPDMVEYLVRLIQYKNAGVATCGIYFNYNGSSRKKRGSGNQYTASARFVIDEINYGGEFTPYLVDKLFERKLLQGIRFQEGISIGEDYRFVIRVLMRDPLVVHGGECKYHYLQHAESVTHRGLGNLKMVYRNRKNYHSTYEMLQQYDSALASGALAYYILQEMAVITSMVKAEEYNRLLAKSVQKEVRRHLREYLGLKRVPLYLKACAFLMSIHEDFLRCSYRAVWKLNRVS